MRSSTKPFSDILNIGKSITVTATLPEALSIEDLTRTIQAVARRLDVADVKDALYFPKYFQIETVRLCNAHCPFCAIDQWDKSTPYMSDALFEKIALELKDYAPWIKSLAMQRAGEPLLDKKLAMRVKMLKELGIVKVTISTNGAAMTEKKARELLVAGLDDVMFSIDSIDREEYEGIKVGLKFDQVLSNIKTFFRLRDEMRPQAIIRIRGVSFHNTAQEDHLRAIARWEDYWRQWTRPQDRIYMKRAHNWGNQKVLDGYTPDYGWVYHPCVIPWSTMHITAMGTVALCPQDYDGIMNLGDINHQTIAEVWRGEKANRIREAHQTGQRNEISLCQGCHLFDADFSLENKIPDLYLSVPSAST